MGFKLKETTVALRGYVDAETLSAKLKSGNGIKMSVARILELAEAGYLPFDIVDGDGPYFKLGEVKTWIKDNLVQEHKAIPFPRRINLVVSENPGMAPGGVPRELAPMADHLHEMPLNNFFRATCIYFLVKSGKVVYVGQSASLAARLACHSLDKEFNRVLYMFVPASEVSRVERDLIRSLRPPLNANCNPDHFAKRKLLK
jgi:hypothetical protein